MGESLLRDKERERSHLAQPSTGLYWPVMGSGSGLLLLATQKLKQVKQNFLCKSVKMTHGSHQLNSAPKYSVRASETTPGEMALVSSA